MLRESCGRKENMTADKKRKKSIPKKEEKKTEVDGAGSATVSVERQGRCFLQDFKAAVDREETVSRQPRLTLIPPLDVCFQSDA